ncbi:MAG: biotin--[acetyl-CoA-carboxylase] ligase [Verrucomicrobiales bacterium]
MSDAVYREIVSGWKSDFKDRFGADKLDYRRSTGSTNDDLLERLRKREAGHLDLIVTESQSSGRGRRGDRWEGGDGRNLLFSLALRLEEDRKVWSRLPHVAAFVVGTAVESILPPGAAVEAKWPNDLLVGSRKLAGILVETTLLAGAFAVVGVGLNVNMRASEWPAPLRPFTTSLYEVLGCESSRWFLLGLIMEGFLEHYPDKTANFAPVLDWISERDFLKGKDLKVTSGNLEISGRSRGLGKDGELLLEEEGGTIRPVISAEKIAVC